MYGGIGRGTLVSREQFTLNKSYEVKYLYFWMFSAVIRPKSESARAEFIQEKNRNRSQIQFPTFPRKEQEEGGTR